MAQSDDSQASPQEEHRFPCDQCGADLRFDPNNSALSCDHCGFHTQIDDHTTPETHIRELDLNKALNQDLPEAEIRTARVSTCSNCAALIEFNEDIHAAQCPFCATPIVIDTGAHRYFKPKGLAPFELDEPQAHDEMNAWLGKLWFAPNGLKDYARKGRKMSGVYVPYWTYDAVSKSKYQGQRGTVHERVRTVTVNGERRQERTQHVSWRSVSGRVARSFDDVLILASRGLPKKYTNALAPWDLSRLAPYRPEYLAGMKSEGYTVDLLQGYHEARVYMDRVILRDVKFDIGGDRQRVDPLAQGHLIIGAEDRLHEERSPLGIP